ncbi:MAG: hypothetical protein ACK44W_03300 [Planctomycetota bacterium]
MSFPAKVAAGTAALLVAAAAAVFLLSPAGAEREIERRIREAARAAERGDAEAVVSFLSKEYRSGDQGYEEAVRRVRREVGRLGGRASLRVDGCAVDVQGAEAEALVRAGVWLGPRPAGGFELRLRLRREEGVWKVTAAEEVVR